LWGELECDYYKSITSDLPEGSLGLFSFAKGAMGLWVSANGVVTIGGLGTGGRVLPIPGSMSIPTPAGWDASSVSSIVVNGLSAGAKRNITLTATLQSGGATINVVATVPSSV
jgi:hypothetical protein